MKEAINAGLNFGLTSGVITTLGLMVGLHSGTNSTLAVIGGVLTIAIADSLSDALGIHIAKEGEKDSSEQEIWAATIMTFIAKFVMAMTFIVPVLILDLTMAVIASIIWGMLVLAILSYFVARQNGDNALYVIVEHLVIALIVIAATHYVGIWVSTTFQ
ncbi:MAG: hypothetical protein HOC70_04305 [Gammaproteobacteria bacterium]|jgi:vacuolar iron transporter family protein|nr:hypothetical protein [Gammaproteobacteria bacterium]MBT4492443.1 hypothetical protein [Gammaproteobacteria bacterium]